MILPGNICGRCKHRQTNDCTANGKPIAVNCAAWDCPLDLFPAHPVNLVHKPYVAPRPVPYDDWPLLHKVIGSFRAPGDVGTGDTFHRAAALINSVLRWMGMACPSCNFRRAEWNAMYRYIENKKEEIPTQIDG